MNLWVVRQILFRAHPEEVAKTNGKYSKPKGAVDATKAGYEATLAKADVVVTGNSGAGVEAMLKGIPVLAGDPGFMAWQCSLHRVEDLFDMRLRDHDACFHQILTSQWSNADIGRGALRYILDPINYRPERQRPPPIVRNATCTDEARGPAGLTVSEPVTAPGALPGSAAPADPAPPTEKHRRPPRHNKQAGEAPAVAPAAPAAAAAVAAHDGARWRPPRHRHIHNNTDVPA